MKVLHSPLKRAFIGTPQSGFCPDRCACGERTSHLGHGIRRRIAAHQEQRP